MSGTKRGDNEENFENILQAESLGGGSVAGTLSSDTSMEDVVEISAVYCSKIDPMYFTTSVFMVVEMIARQVLTSKSGITESLQAEQGQLENSWLLLGHVQQKVNSVESIHSIVV